MSTGLRKIFKKENRIVIGSLHFPPLLGEKGFPGFDESLRMAVTDLSAYEEGGVDGLFLENNYGLSNKKITSAQAVSMGYLIGEIRSRTKLPLGASVLWNDYETAFALAKTYNLDFIRVPVFVDTIETYCGIIKGNPKAVRQTQQRVGAENVAIYADVKVKHAKHISKHTLTTSARKSMQAGADAIIVTGEWTGDAPATKTLANLRKKIDKFPILVGSGADRDNVSELLQHANGVIVSTSLKAGSSKRGERNVKGFEQRVQRSRVTSFVRAVKNAPKT